MSEITVVNWICPEDADKRECSIGGMGGFPEAMLWEDYIEGLPEDKLPYYNALRASILKNGAISGDDHQRAEYGTPLFSDGTIASFSFRGWGDLLASIFNSKINEKKWQYMDFYYTYLPDDPRLQP